MIEKPERKLLDAIQPYVLLAASTLISCSYNANFAAFGLVQQPHSYRARAKAGRVSFEVPEWLPFEECLFTGPGGALNAVVKHLALRRRAEPGAGGVRNCIVELPPGLAGDGSEFTLTYFAWFRFAAPPFDFHAEGRAAHYVGEALQHLAQSRGLVAGLDLQEDAAVVQLTDRLRIEVVGNQVLTELSVLASAEETTIGLGSLTLDVSGTMFPDVHHALRDALAAGEVFRGLALNVDADRALLHARGAADVQA